MSEQLPPDWAIEKALKLMANGCQPSLGQCKCRPEYWTAQINVARYIAEHEDEPVDPLLVEAREIVAKYWKARGNQGFADKVGAGECDSHSDVASSFAALRRGIELAKGGAL